MSQVKKMGSEVKVAVCWANLGPYHIDRVKRLCGFLPNLIAIETTSDKQSHPWRVSRNELPFPVKTLFQKPYEELRWWELARGMKNYLDNQDFEVIVVAGIRSPEMLTAALWAKRHQVPCVSFWASHRSRGSRCALTQFLKGLLVKWLISAIGCTGIRAKQYLRSLGVQESSIWRLGNVVDNQEFVTASDQRENEQSIQSNLNLPTNYFLYCGRFSPEKNLQRLIRAFSLYQNCGGEWELVLVGDGSEQTALQDIVTEESLQGVQFVPWLQREALKVAYGSARCFVLPSISETWGLVVNEAMAAGLPLLVSRNCGCVPELCWRGVNGYDFDPYDVGTLANLMLKISSGQVDLDRLGRASRRIVSAFTPETWAMALADCINEAWPRGTRWK